MELFKFFKDSFYPSVDLGFFDKCECNCDLSDWGFKAWNPLVGHHVDLQFSDECVGSRSVTIKDEGGNAHRFEVSCGLDGNEMSGGYRSWASKRIAGSSGSPWASWASWASWCSSQSDVKHVSDMLQVLLLCMNGSIVVVSRYKGSRDDLCGRRQGLSRHSVATAFVTSDWGVLASDSFSVWASWAASVDNCWCAPDLYVDRQG